MFEYVTVEFQVALGDSAPALLSLGVMLMDTLWVTQVTQPIQAIEILNSESAISIAPE